MLLFLLLLLPSALFKYFYLIKEKKFILQISAGFVTAMIVCACRFFFSYEHRLVYYAFAENFFYYFVKQNFIPLVVVAAVYALVSKDSLRYKISSFFPLMCSFFAVYLPYCVITASEYYYQGYDIFLKPIIYLAMLVQLSRSLNALYNAVTNRKGFMIFIHSVLILFYAVYPAVSDALYAIDFSFGLILIIGLVYSLLPAVFFTLSLITKKTVAE